MQVKIQNKISGPSGRKYLLVIKSKCPDLISVKLSWGWDSCSRALILDYDTSPDGSFSVKVKSDDVVKEDSTFINEIISKTITSIMKTLTIKILPNNS